MALNTQGQHGEEAAMYREMLEVQKQALGQEHPDTLCTGTYLADALHGGGQHAEAAAVYRETLEVRKRVLGQEHPDTLRTIPKLAIMCHTRAGR